MYMPPGSTLRLDPRDEYTHVPEDAANYNESMYFNAFDTARGIGAWMRLGNRPHEGHAEMTCCVYLPDGRVGFMHARPHIANNDAMDAGGLRFEVIEPFKRLRATYEGELLLMDDPHAMADPSSAFKRYPKRPASIALDFEGVSPMHGGEIVAPDGSRLVLDPASAVYRGHTEQSMAVRGHIAVDGQRFDIDGTGYRDKSWGPRHWHSFHWYKWLPVTFGRDFGVLLSVKGRKDHKGQAHHVSGNVLRNGRHEPVIDGRIVTVYDERYFPRSFTAHVRTAERSYTLQGKVGALVPLRHKRAGGAGEESSYTRITEGITEYSCEGRRVLGMSEYCDVMVDGTPISVLEEPAP
ncbi:hypothetical protein SAMN05216567_118133 [Variovorax sp. OK605]|uniref:DUF7064 domain-containing protein n=1 Tax=Variovorax sp. OK605 TaxID=1855317 RepID=UPI0008E8544A|nr:hypothetical protein [Variovorax sp. OK605]SFQ53086.1 hypothetical protein SAMN05216567_118133 [Variovorax sp. OK605]